MEVYTSDVKEIFKKTVKERTERIRRELKSIENLIDEIENGPPPWETKKDKLYALSRNQLKLASALTKKYDVNKPFTATDVFNYLWNDGGCGYFEIGEKNMCSYCVINEKFIEPRKVRNEIIPNALNALVEKGALKTRMAYGKNEGRILMMRHYALLTKDINKSNDV